MARTITPVELRTVEAILAHGDIKRAAKAMGLSPRTLSNRMHSAYSGMLVRNFGQLVDALHKNGQLR